MKPQFLVGAMMPGSGQTLVALGLMRALRQRNLRVQSFKCGPELADLRYHALAADRGFGKSGHLAGSRSHLQTVYNRYGGEGRCMRSRRTGRLFDGFRKTQGSSAEMARLMKIPVVMVASARNAGYSTPSHAVWLQTLQYRTENSRVIFNQVTSAAQYGFLRELLPRRGGMLRRLSPLSGGNRPSTSSSGTGTSCKGRVSTNFSIK